MASEDQNMEFDPAEHTAAEVTEYLAEADPEEARAVLQAEEEGKARKTVLESDVAEQAGPRYEPDGREKYPWEV